MLAVLFFMGAVAADDKGTSPIVTAKTADSTTIHGYQFLGEYTDLARWLNKEGFRVLAWDLRNGANIYGSDNRTVRDMPADTPNGYCDASIRAGMASRAGLKPGDDE